jgi:hypothetical protein
LRQSGAENLLWEPGTPDQPVEPAGSEPYGPNLETRVSRLEDDVSDMAASIGRLAVVTGRLDERVGRLEATTDRLAATTERLDGRVGHLEAGFARLEALFISTLPHLATKEEVARLPTKTYVWAVLAVLITAMYGAFGAGLAAIALLR